MMIRVRVPGKVMLAGEYAVLTGEPCVAITVPRYLNVTITPSATIAVHSDLWSQPLLVDKQGRASDLRLAASPLGRAVLEIADRCPPFALKVESDLRIKDGLGSSSALRLGVTWGLLSLAEKTGPGSYTADHELAKTAALRAIDLQRSQQGQASGYDVYTQLLGGLVRFQMPNKADRLPTNPAFARCIHIYGGGRGAPTNAVMNNTLQGVKRKRDQLNAYSRQAVECFLEFAGAAVLPKDLPSAVAQLRSVFEQTAFYPNTLSDRLKLIPGCDLEWTFKTTGAGGEDAILLIGEIRDLTEAHQALISMGWKRLDLNPLPAEGADLIVEDIL